MVGNVPWPGVKYTPWSATMVTTLPTMVKQGSEWKTVVPWSTWCRGKQHQFEFHFSVQVTAGLTLFTARVHSANHVATVVCCCLVLKQLYFSVTVALRERDQDQVFSGLWLIWTSFGSSFDFTSERPVFTALSSAFVSESSDFTSCICKSWWPKSSFITIWKRKGKRKWKWKEKKISFKCFFLPRENQKIKLTPTWR